MSDHQPNIIILTLAIGADYRRSMSKCLESKRAYAARHGYKYIEGGDEWWDHSRPIAWSKMAFYMHYMQEALKSGEETLIWLSDADVYITNPEVRIEDHIGRLTPNKDMLVCVDSFDHINSGNIFVRPTQRIIEWFRWVDSRTECTNHIWWENGAMLLCWKDRPTDLEWVEIDRNPRRFNAYVNGLPGRAVWTPGDWLVHFAGIYNGAEIDKHITAINKTLLSHDTRQDSSRQAM